MNIQKQYQKKRYYMQNMVTRIHLVGIGGVGMLGIAEVLHNLGMIITGSDIRESIQIDRIKDIGIKVQVGHEPNLVMTAEVVVVTSAVDESNKEIIYAQNARIPIISRAEMLAELMRERYGIAVAGTHGKTTTTSLLASILTEANEDPTYIIGGQLNQSGKNATLGKGSLLVAEADESDASFLYLKPRISIVTNIDAEHMQTYNGNMSDLLDVFVQFLLHLPFYGRAILCADNDNVQKIIPKVMRPITTYGLSAKADVQATNLNCTKLTSTFDVVRKDKSTFKVVLNIPGKHNVLNALSSIVVAEMLGISTVAIKRALKKFHGVNRRFEVYNCKQLFNCDFTLVDDYGHHPTEIEAVLQTARSIFVKNRIVLLFQPHRYSRTRDLFDDFVKVLPQVDLLILMDVYAAGEKPIAQFDSKSLIKQIRLVSSAQAIAVSEDDDLDKLMTDVIQNEDVLLTMGAGDIGQISKKWRRQAKSAVRQI